MNTVDVNLNKHIDFNKENNKKGPKFNVDDHLKMSKYGNIFAKAYVPNWPEEVFVIKKVKNNVSWSYAISDLNGEEKEFQKNK